MSLDEPPPGVIPLYRQRQYLGVIRRRQAEGSRRVRPFMAIGLSKVIPPTVRVIDLGAGIGKLAWELEEFGYEVRAVDGTPGIEGLTEGRVEEFDLLGDCSPLFGWAEWAIFADVGEHIPKEYEQTLLDNVCRIPRLGLVVSWSLPKYDWFKGHVNCRETEYVIAEVEKRGWRLDDNRMGVIPEWTGPDVEKRRLLLFERKDRK